MKLLLILLAANVLASPEDDLRSGNVQFSVKLYREILKTRPNQNFVFAPFPVQTVLAALASSVPNSNSETVTQIRNVAGLPQSNNETERAFRNIISNLTKTDDDFKIFDASKFYFARGYSVKPWYRTIAQETYQTEIETVNFANTERVVDQINTWVSKKTDDKIYNFLAPGDVASNTRNVLVNALYVAGKWDKPFDKHENVRRKFYGPLATKEIDMMNNLQSYEYADDSDAQYLKMNLVREDGGAYVVFILPQKTVGLSQVETRVGNVLKSATYFVRKVDVTIPKFTIDSDIKLKPILKSLGIEKLFAWGIELAGLEYPGHGWMIVSDVCQKSFIQVSERGVTAAVASKAVVIVDDANSDEKVFTADRPFLFKIVVDGIIMFAGRVVDP